MLGLLLLAAQASLAAAATLTYNWNITWVITNPDGAYYRPTIGINGQWPLPKLEASVGDRIVVNVQNQLGNRTTSIHFHGLYMNGSNHMDGPVGATQCAIPIGGSMIYDFNVSLKERT
jgi:iron transport multicopper oxidase